MATPAPFTPAALTFLKQLRANNRREWFQPRKAQFEELLRRPMLELAAGIGDDLRSFAVEHVRPAQRAVHRIYRDVRFSKDKSPYKQTVSAMWPRAGLGKMSGAGYYLGVSPDGVEIAAGLFGPGPAELAAVRGDIDRNTARFRKLVEQDRSLLKAMGRLQGEQLVRVPKGFSAGHPAADLLRRTQFYFHVMLRPAEAHRPRLRKTIVDRFRAAAPFVDHLNGLILAAERTALGEDERPKRPAPMF
jgi:uncharacterized protein (TIGR02453 family)